MSRSILTDELFESFSSSILPSADAESLPPACYVDEEFFRFEKQALFYREWLCVGRESWVRESGDYFTSRHVGEPIVVTRTREGEVAAMSAVCQHRGMVVAEGYGNVKSLLCPYHHWVYSLSGELIGAPEMGRTCNFDKAEHGCGWRSGTDSCSSTSIPMPRRWRHAWSRSRMSSPTTIWPAWTVRAQARRHGSTGTGR
jgi:nitrite reductase/ring-hydroxylating ferredoxin subunit